MDPAAPGLMVLNEGAVPQPAVSSFPTGRQMPCMRGAGRPSTPYFGVRSPRSSLFGDTPTNSTFFDLPPHAHAPLYGPRFRSDATRVGSMRPRICSKRRRVRMSTISDVGKRQFRSRFVMGVPSSRRPWSRPSTTLAAFVMSRNGRFDFPRAARSEIGQAS